jgi:hypothetical protein
MNKNVKIKGKKHIKYVDKMRALFKSKVEQIDFAYNNSESTEFYQEVSNTVQ